MSHPSTQEYFRLMEKIQQYRKERRYQEALSCCLQSLPNIVSLFADPYLADDEGNFGGSSIPAIQDGVTFAAILQDEKSLREIESLVLANPKLSPWQPCIEGAKEDFILVKRILEAVNSVSSADISGLKEILNFSDGRRLSILINWLEKAGRVKTSKVGNKRIISRV